MYKKNYPSRNIRGKLKVCRYLREDPATRRFIPTTRAFTLANLRKMTDRHAAVYIKPDIGSMGIGICKLTRLANGYELAVSSKRKQRREYLPTRAAVYKYIKKQQPGRKLIIQKAIALDTVDGKPYDIRAMVQRKPGQSWTCTGYMVKVGKPNRIVTNYYQGGKIYTLAKWMRKKGWSETSKQRREAELTDASLAISHTLSRKRKGMFELGIDFAYDQGDRLWVLEVNSNHPQFHPLRKLDPKAFRRMKRYASSYGRHDA
ncbi:hypothetical protein PA598K_02526 [Paenibacillus sp. 598K]|uniref:YheC/YheD family protein n=1 Tax=Paenibacillus sp. 598K TaxID=1117987 RepID=UPI000FFA7962|nr:YheC/YheD family protein [Paenibacillus sp. 598K]GBF74194.1 hypothetical protein PA598K_02526 [Paenibacillus sp. 598K]